MKTAFLSLIFDYPITLNSYSIFEIGSQKPYIDCSKTKESFQSDYYGQYKGYLEEILKESYQDTPISIYFSGVFIDLLQQTDADMISKIKHACHDTKLELIGGTINNSLSCLYNEKQFEAEVKAHKTLLKSTFDYKPTCFYNAENIYYNPLAEKLKKWGFKKTFAGAIDWYLGKKNNDRVFIPKRVDGFNLLVIDKDNSLFNNPKQKVHFLQFDLEGLKQFRGVKRILIATKYKAKMRPLSGSGRYNSKELYYIKTPTMGSLNQRTLKSYNGQAMQSNTMNMYYSISEQFNLANNTDYLTLGSSLLYLSLNPEQSKNKDCFEKYNNFMNILNDAEIKA